AQRELQVGAAPSQRGTPGREEILLGREILGRQVRFGRPGCGGRGHGCGLGGRRTPHGNAFTDVPYSLRDGARLPLGLQGYLQFVDPLPDPPSGDRPASRTGRGGGEGVRVRDHLANTRTLLAWL